MLAELGLTAVGIAFLLAVYATAMSAWGGWRQQPAWVQSARSAVLLIAGLLTLAVGTLVYSLQTSDFSIAYVGEVSNLAMPSYLRLSSLWGGQPGSLLFWAWLMSCFVAAVMLGKWDQDRDLMPYFITVATLTTGFFIGVTLFISNPFARLWLLPGADQLTTAVFAPAEAILYRPPDGNGLNPLLRHFGMIFHPPTTYLGFTGFVIPYAFAVSALMSGRARDDQWIRTSRRWTLVAWVFLSVGLLLGGRWAYDVLGWGGFWGWDPVENAMLLPWLTGTAFLHSVMITERRGMLKVWSVLLIVITYSLALFGTFITRSGVISSVHAFGKSALGPAFFVFIGITFLATMGLLIKRLDLMRSDHEMESFLSREAAFLLQNVIFLAITFVVFLGTVFPLLSEMVTGDKITVGPPYFKATAGPLFALLLLLMGVAPLIAWRKQVAARLGDRLLAPTIVSIALALLWGYAVHSPWIAYPVLWLVVFATLAILIEFWKGIQARMSHGEDPVTGLISLVTRNRRRYGGYLVHLAVVMIGMGFIGEAFFQQQSQGTLAQGESMTLAGYSVRFEGVRQYIGADGRQVTEATTSVMRDNQVLGVLHPRQDFFAAHGQRVTAPDSYSTLGGDVYVILVGWDDIGTGGSTFKVYYNPMILWTWLGAFLLMGGTLIAMWPEAAGRSQRSYVLEPVSPEPPLGAGGAAS